MTIPTVQPSTLSLITTYKCTSACPNCCFNCSPNPRNPRMMTREEMCSYIEQAKKAFPSIHVVVFTGGECTLLKEALLSAISYAKKLGLTTRIVTNGFWGVNSQYANALVDKFVDAGLDEVNFSSGDEHAAFVPIDYIINAIDICANRKELTSVVLNVEASPDHRIDRDTFIKHSRIESLSPSIKRKIVILQSTWIKFRNQGNCVQNENHILCLDSNKGCNAILDTITINPNAQFLSCCGLVCEYSPLLKLGKVNENIETLHESRFNDVLKLWIYSSGPLSILKQLGVPVQENKHMCEYCLDLLSQKDVLSKLLSIDRSTVEKILLNYSLKATRHAKQIH